MRYTTLFFDLDHTLWDFEANAKQTLLEMYERFDLPGRGIHDFGLFHQRYLHHNDRLWDRYRKGFIKQEELRWKRMWHTLLEFKIGDEALSKQLSVGFLDALPTRNLLFPYTIEILDYLKGKGYQMHLITNGFDEVQQQKIKHSGLSEYFGEMITSQNAMSLKPEKAIFTFALQKTGADHKSSIMIGDNIEVDIIGAMNAGMDQIWVNHTQDTTTVKPTYTITHLQQLHAIL